MNAKQESNILRELVKDWKAAIEKPEIARALMLQRASFQCEQIRESVSALLLSDGDVHRAVQWIEKKIGAKSASKFARWCDRVRGGAK